LCSPSKASLSICFIFKLKKFHLFTWRVLSGQYALISFPILVFSSIRNLNAPFSAFSSLLHCHLSVC
jgi:hypothetical protein